MSKKNKELVQFPCSSLAPGGQSARYRQTLVRLHISYWFTDFWMLDLSKGPTDILNG
jgi:hypothetical protein